MNKIIKGICKKALIFTMCIITFGSAIMSSMTYAKANTLYNQLGSRAALGSPVLNNNFTSDQWNKWETVVWGIFLSNFCVPLIDNYRTAFTSSGEGSGGSGYQALQFGTGTDASNAEVIENFCNLAVRMQESSSTKLYVSYSFVENSKIVVEGNTQSAIQGENRLREAIFKDLFLVEGNPEISLIDDVANSTPIYKISDNHNKYYENLYEVASYTGLLPTFWVKTNTGTYEKVFDYTDPWDVQITTLMMSKIMESDRGDEFFKVFESLYGSENSIIRFDCFGNIVTSDNKIIIPAAANKNLTLKGDINLLNSFVVNGLTETSSNEDLLSGTSQFIPESAFIGGMGEVGDPWYKNSIANMVGFGDNWVGGTPALSGKYSKIPEGSTHIYYDFDNATVLNGSYSNLGKTMYNFLANADIENRDQKYNLKVESSNILTTGWFLGKAKDAETGSKVLAQNQIAASLVSTYLTPETQPNILTEITYLDGTKYSLFDEDPLLINVQLLTDEKDTSYSKATRTLYNFFYQSLKGKSEETVYGGLSSSTIQKNLNSDSIQNGNDFVDLIIEDLKIYEVYNRLYGTSYKTGGWDWKNNESFNNTNLRTIILYPASSILKTVGDILSVDKDTDFALYSPYIYVTYLEFYGIIHTTDLLGDTKQSSDLKEELFDISADFDDIDPENELGTMSEEEIEKQVMNYSYLMLSPTAGRAYRTELITNGISDWIYDTYKRIVFGTATTEGSSISTKSNSGFLHVDTYTDNPLTAPFINIYSDIALTIIIGAFVAMVIIGLITRKQLSWYAITAVIIVNTVLLVPSTGELVPYFTSNLVQSMFTNKMTYWAVSEAVSNASLEYDAVTGGLTGLTDDEALQVAKLVKNLNVNYLDRSLMVKRDISAKVTQKLADSYTDIQSIASARWLLPTIMRQYQNEDSKSDYVYIPLSDLYDDMSNMYWFFDQNDTQFLGKETLTSEQNKKATKVDDLKTYYKECLGSFTDFNRLSYNVDSEDTSVKERILVAYDDMDKNKVRNIEYQASCYKDSYFDNPSALIHTYSYIMDDLHVPTRRSLTGYGADEFSDVTEMYEDYVVNASASTLSGKYKIKLNEIEEVADSYTRTDRSTIHKDYSYLWATETPTHYFYTLVKDTFSEAGLSTGKLIGSLQGQIGLDANDKQVRDSFMHATEILETGEEVSTGYTRDILDLQCMFSNMVPYLYQTQITAGGMDGQSGVLGDTQIKNLGLYKGELGSWLFRCNWAVKIMESPEYNKPMKVKDATGESYTVSNPILPECYPSERPMVYSEAQMYAYGLDEDDLNIVELKCIKANREIANKWTMLINYAGTSNLTSEVLMRQMALDASLIFNETFSPSGVFNASYAMYPQTVDLRNISFDSIMKMIMLNVSKDTSYIYGDTMAALIDTTDIFTSLLLLIVAFMCAYIIPGIRTLLMAAIFYLGFMAIIKAIFASNKYKAKVTGGQLVSNILFLFITFCFYGVFYLLINITSSDEVLITSQAAVTPGNPVWSLALVLIACIAYTAGMIAMINFCFKNYRDMGMEVYSMIAHSTTDKIKNGIGGLRADLGKRAKASEAAEKINAKTGTKEGNANRNNSESNNVVVNVTTESHYDKKRDKFTTSNKIKADFKREERSNYNDKALSTRSADIDISDSIDAKIKKGAKQNQGSSKNKK